MTLIVVCYTFDVIRHYLQFICAYLPMLNHKEASKIGFIEIRHIHF